MKQQGAIGDTNVETQKIDKIAIRTFIDEANLASQNAAQCGKNAREAWNDFVVARASASEATESLRVLADKALNVYALAHKCAVEKASVSSAAIAEFEANLKIRCARLGVEM
jgi:hypothetical protein